MNDLTLKEDPSWEARSSENFSSIGSKRTLKSGANFNMFSVGFVDFDNLHPDSINIGCDSEDRPTSAYIDTYSGVYTNPWPLLTTWVDDYKQAVPRNNLVDQC
ncbi:hypothetical protein C8F04DRAFT_1248469 [Mycena alexandri]|uniref:Uncharacterized protein n=1 Tax=Mycena alexandri TaxID=1745969 RepID=A0AAD6THK5_9AGAR|nr:hypothetical protein C8F04DRAFT_1248469 [Mycena alexandri]